MDPESVRDGVLQRLRADLVGPLSATEELAARPSDVYLTGIIWPQDSQMGGEEDDGGFGQVEEDSPDPTPVGQQRPCSMGLSFATSTPTSSVKSGVRVRVEFATYLFVEEPDESGRLRPLWRRFPHTAELELELPEDGSEQRLLDIQGESRSTPVVQLHVRSIPTPEGRLSTITLINRSRPEAGDRRGSEQLTLFQTRLDVHPATGTTIIPRPPVQSPLDEDHESSLLLYRDCHEFATGHQCSAEWESDGRQAKLVSTSWIPTAVVPAYRETGDDHFDDLLSSGRLGAAWLADATAVDLERALTDLSDCYARWIEHQRATVPSLPQGLRPTAHRHITACEEVRGRILDGARAIARDATLCRSFQLANRAMSMQHGWKRGADGESLPELVWRPFQLGFILLAAQSASDPQNEHRSSLDLLWFPTGGGKTEAYLALVAMVAWHRRLSSQDPDAGAGNAALMRYTLRLLTAQQFERAGALILACELLRRDLPWSQGNALGSTPFSAGLWVGGDATPNTFGDAIAARGSVIGTSAEQIQQCYACQGAVRWSYEDGAERVVPHCPEPDCALGTSFGPWPIFTVDSDIYRERPTLVIGTIDKFAQLPFKEEIGRLFGFGTDHATDLVIQDELHLISGPLGTIAGIYETALDWLLSKWGRPPKVVGSTATIRRAKDQVRSLFDRDVCQFPPPGLDYSNSGFAVVAADRPGRRYAAVTTSGRSAKFTLQATIGSLLQSCGPANTAPPEARDGYATLLCYFNSLRELGGAIVQVLDDAPDSVALYSRNRVEPPREIRPPLELTSRVTQREIVAALRDLARNCDDPDAVDVVLATNMVSVGVDVPRLGLMLVNGQPKTRSEYIQSTSRVGRSSYPGLVVGVMNAAKARDRSHFETFPAWHATLYRDVEATSVTPFASRARDKALKAVLVSMLRHSEVPMRARPDLDSASEAGLRAVVEAIEQRIRDIDPAELADASRELDEALEQWEVRQPRIYLGRGKNIKSALMQTAEDHARRVAAGRIPSAAWPTMNTMRNVEPSSPFRMAEVLSDASTPGGRPGVREASSTSRPAPRWRRNG